MKYFIPILLALLAGWYFTTGVRLGLVTFTPTTMFNANGSASYNLRAFEDKQQVGLVGSCRVTAGRATIVLLSPSGTQVAGQECVPAATGEAGHWSINVVGRGQPGNYKAVVNYSNFNGSIELNDASPR